MQLRVYAYVAADLPDDPVDDGKSQPGSLIHFLSGKEWLEKVLLHLLAYTHASVGYDQFHVGTGLYPGQSRGAGLADVQVPQNHGQPASVRACVPPGHRPVHKYPGPITGTG